MKTFRTTVKYRTAAAAGVALMVIGCSLAVAVPAGLGWDFANFYDAGQKALAGQIDDLYNPESLIEGRQPQGGMTFWSVPLFSYFLAPMAWFSPGTALVLFKIQNVVALFAALLILFAESRRFLPRDAEMRAVFAALFVWLALLFQPLWTVFRVGGQTTPTVLLLLVLGLVAHTRERWWVSSLCYVLAVIVKPSFAVGLIFLALVSGWPFFAAASIWGLSLAATAILVMGWPVHRTFLELLATGAGRSTAWMHNSSLTVVLENLRLLSVPGATAYSRPPAIAAAIALVKLAVVALFAVLAWRARRLPSPARWHALFLLSVLFALLVSPIVWEHYLALLFIPLAYLLAVRSELDKASLWAMGLIFLFAIGQNLVLVMWLEATFTFDSAPELVAIGLLKSAPLLLTLILLRPRRGGLLGSYAHTAWHEAR